MENKYKRSRVQRSWESLSTLWMTIMIVRHCESRGVLTIRLLHYQNDYGQTFDGDCCDHRSSLNVFQPQNCGVQCDYVLRLLITGLGRANEHVFRFRRPIKYNANNIKFEDSTAELTIPFSSWPGEAGLLVFFYDYDDTDDSARLVDWFQTRLIHPGNVAYQELYGNRKLHKTRLQFDWSVKSEGSLKKADSSNPFTTLRSPVSEYRSAWKILNAKYERIKEVTPVISNTLNSSSRPSLVEKMPVLHTAKVTKRLSQNKTDSYSTASTNVAPRSKQHNEAKRLPSQILSPSEPTNLIKNITVVRQNQTGLFNNKTTSRLYWRTSHLTPFRLNNQSTPTTLSTSIQSVNSSRVRSLRRTLPSSDTVRNAVSLKSLKDVNRRGRSRVAGVANENNTEFPEGDDFTFDQGPSIVVTKWQESLDHVKRHGIKTAAAAASLQMRKKTKEDLSLRVDKDRGSSPSEETINDLRSKNEGDIKLSELNKKVINLPLKEEIVKDVRITENSGNKSNPNKQIKNKHMKLKYKSSDSHTQVTASNAPNDKLGFTNSKIVQITEAEFKRTRFEVDSTSNGIKSIDLTNKKLVTNKKIPTPLPMDSNLDPVGDLSGLTTGDAPAVRRRPAKSAKGERAFNDIRKTTDPMTNKNYQKDNENAQRRSMSNPGLKASAEQTRNGSGDFEAISNTNTQDVPMTNIETPSVKRTSSAHDKQRKKHPEAESTTLKKAGSSVTNKKTTINSFASRRKNNIKKTFGENENLHNQKKIEEPEVDNKSIVLKENGLRNNKASIKELRHSKLLEIDSSKKQYSQRLNQIPENKDTGGSKFTDKEELTKDQAGTGRESNTKTKVWQKNPEKAEINKNDLLYERSYLTAVSLQEVNSNPPDDILRVGKKDSGKNKGRNGQWFSLEQILRPNQKHDPKRIERKLDLEPVVKKTKTGFIYPESILATVKETNIEISNPENTPNQKHDPKRLERKLDLESVVKKTKTGFIYPEYIPTTIKETNVEISSALRDPNSQNDFIEQDSPKTTQTALTDNMTSILFSLPNFKDNITTRQDLQETYTFYNKEIGTTEEMTRNEKYPTKENSDKSKQAKSFPQKQNQTVLSPKQFDKNILKEWNYGSKNGKTRTAALRKKTQSTSTTKSYYDESLTNSTIKSAKSLDTRLSNNNETIKHKNTNWSVTNSFLTETTDNNGLEISERRSQNPRHRTTSSEAEEKTVNNPSKKNSIKRLKSRNYTPIHNLSPSNPSSAEKNTEKIPTKLPHSQKIKNVHRGDKIKMEDITVRERQNPSTHASIKTTMADNENTIEDSELHSVSLRYTRGNLLTLELKSKVSGKSLEYSSVTDSSNKDFNHNNRNIQTKENTLVGRIIDGRHRKINKKGPVKEASIDKGYEDRFNAGNSLESGFSNVHSIFPVFSTTPGFNQSPVFYSTIVANSNNLQRTKEDSTAPTPSSIRHLKLESGDQNDSLSINPPQTTKRYKKQSEDQLVLTTTKRGRFSDDSDDDDYSEKVTTIDNSKTIKKNPFDDFFNEWTSAVTKITNNSSFLKPLKNVNSQSASKTTSIWNQITASLPFSQENQNSTKIKTKTSESIKRKGSSSLLNKNKVTPNKLRTSENNPSLITQTLSASSTRGLKMKTPTTTRGYLKRTLPKWIIFPQNFEDFLRHSHRKPYREPSQQTRPATKTSPSYEQNEMHPKAAANDKPLSRRATTPGHFVPRWSTVYLKEKKLYQPSAKSLTQNQPKRTEQEQTPKNTTDRIRWATINNTQNIGNTNLLQDNSMEENWRFQSILEIRDVFEKYWPAILGSTVGALFLGAAILTSFMCKRRTRVRRRRVRRSSRDQRYSPQPPVSEYSSGSSLFEENSPVSETPTSIDEIS